MNLFQFFAITAAVFSAVSASPYNFPNGKNDDTVYFRGKQFQKNGSSKMSSLSIQAQNYTEQCMDHNDKTCNQTWSQRYFVNKNYYTEGGPVFFMLGAESPADGWVDGGRWLFYAQTYGAVLVILEHRFYGKSFPTMDTSLKSLRLLNSKQALADGAKFIEYFKSSNNYTNAKVVVFGGSYGGNLAAWFRQKYPKSANLAVSSSAPLQAQFDFPEYMRTISEVIFHNNRTCYMKLRDSFNCVENIVKGKRCRNTTYTEKTQIGSALHQCYDYEFSDQYETESFFRWMIMTTWSTNYPFTDDMGKCDTLNQQKVDDILDNYGNFLTAIGEGKCVPGANSKAMTSSNKENIREFINSAEGKYSGVAGWFWQTCNEFGYYQTADPKYKVFATSLTTLTYVQECIDQFGPTFTSEYIQSRVAQTNTYYKGKNNDGTCIIFVNGGYDPWHPLGINRADETSPKNSVVYIPTGEHCSDQGLDSTDDLKIGMARIEAQIGVYLKDPNCV